MLNDRRIVMLVSAGSVRTCKRSLCALVDMALSFDLETAVVRDIPSEPDLESVRRIVRGN